MKLIELLEKYCERIEKELEDEYKKIEKLNPLPIAELDVIDKLLHSLKSVKTVLAKLEYDDDEDDRYSGKYPKRFTNDSHGYSGRDDYGTRRLSRSYSRDSEKNDMVRKLEDMMNRVRSDEEAMAIQDTLAIVNRM